MLMNQILSLINVMHACHYVNGYRHHALDKTVVTVDLNVFTTITASSRIFLYATSALPCPNEALRCSR